MDFSKHYVPSVASDYFKPPPEATCFIPKPWILSDDCTDCSTDTICCRDPDVKETVGACYKTDKCSNIIGQESTI